VSKHSEQLREVARRLLAIADSLDAASMSAESKPRRATKTLGAPNVSVEGLRLVGRAEAEQQLQAQPKKSIEDLFRTVGGSSTDAKRPKAELIGRILHRVFDFDAGQDLLRGSGPTRPPTGPQ
jgi:hypothetical protein